jgi:hypothetical protein
MYFGCYHGEDIAGEEHIRKYNRCLDGLLDFIQQALKEERSRVVDEILGYMQDLILTLNSLKNK